MVCSSMVLYVFSTYFVGGALGGASAAIACGINTTIFRSSMNIILKYILSLIVSLLAVGTYLIMRYMALQALR